MGAEGEIKRIKWTVADYHRMAEVGLLAPDARVELIDGYGTRAPVPEDRISILALPTISIDVADLFSWSGR